MSSSMAMWDDVPSYSPSDYNRPLGGRRGPTASERWARRDTLTKKEQYMAQDMWMRIKCEHPFHPERRTHAN